MLPLLRSELFRLNRRWMPRILLLIVVLGVVAVYALLWVTLATQSDTGDLQNDLSLAETLDMGLVIAYFFASIMTVIMSASLVGTEYGWGTIRALLPRARSRVGLLVAKFATLVVFNLVLIIAGFVAAFVMSYLVTSAENLDDALGGDFALDAVLAIGRTVYVLLPYTALAFFVAVLTRSNAAGIAIGLVVLLAESIVVSILTAVTDIFDWLGTVLFTENAAAITDLNDGTTSGGLPDPWLATLVLGLWIAAFVALALIVFRRRDVTSGT